MIPSRFTITSVNKIPSVRESFSHPSSPPAVSPPPLQTLCGCVSDGARRDTSRCHRNQRVERRVWRKMIHTHVLHTKDFQLAKNLTTHTVIYSITDAQLVSTIYFYVWKKKGTHSPVTDLIRHLISPSFESLAKSGNGPRGITFLNRDLFDLKTGSERRLTTMPTETGTLYRITIQFTVDQSYLVRASSITVAGRFRPPKSGSSAETL